MKVHKNLSVLVTAIMLFTFSNHQVAAQVDRYVDKVKLNNGSTIWGLTEIKQDQVIIFVTEEDSLIVPAENIKSLKTGKLNPDLYLDRVQKFYYQVSTGVLVGSSHQYSSNEASFSASFISGYKLKRMLGLGLGVGVDFYPNQRHIPLSLDVQGDLIPGRVTPFYQLNVGYGWAQERSVPVELERLTGGLYFRPSVGVKWHFAGHSWLLRISYVRQESKMHYEPIDLGNGSTITTVEDRVLQRLGFGLGIYF